LLYAEAKPGIAYFIGNSVQAERRKLALCWGEAWNRLF